MKRTIIHPSERASCTFLAVKLEKGSIWAEPLAGQRWLSLPPCSASEPLEGCHPYICTHQTCKLTVQTGLLTFDLLPGDVLREETFIGSAHGSGWRSTLGVSLIRILELTSSKQCNLFHPNVCLCSKSNSSRSDVHCLFLSGELYLSWFLSCLTALGHFLKGLSRDGLGYIGEKWMLRELLLHFINV